MDIRIYLKELKMNLYEEYAYLTTKNKYRYSSIMEIFLTESERIHMEITEDFIYEKVLRMHHLQENDYSKQQLVHDLQFLIENGNISIQEENLQNIHTLDEYKNRKKYYSITKKGAFVARNIRQYLLMSSKTSLCDEHFERLIKDIRECKHKNSYSAWDMFFEDARTVFQIYQDFLAEFNSMKFEKLVNTREFLSYKKEFLEQIHLLIEKLSKYAGMIGNELEGLSSEDDRLKFVRRWFLYVNDEEPTYINILHYCSVLIEKITRKAKLLVTAGEESADYKNILYQFMGCETIEECENLSLSLFGYQRMNHMNYHGPYTVKETELKVRQEKVIEYYDESQKLEDEKKALEYLDRELKREQRILLAQEEKKLRFEDLKNLDTQDMLTVLSWLGRGMEDKNKCSETGSGKTFRIEESEEKESIIFETKHGSLTMPNFQFVFEDGNNE